VTQVSGRDVTITNPGKVFFPQAGHTKLDLVQYYLAVAEGAVRGVRARPMALKRFPNGVEESFFFQKRAPTTRPDWVETVELRFPSGRTAQEIVIRDAAQLAWIVNLGCVDLNPHAVRVEDLDHPDELRMDLDPVPGIEWSQIREVAFVTQEVLSEHGLVGWPKTSGSRGIHINVRISPKWTFGEVRRAALAIGREVTKRAPTLATVEWWKENRHGVFLDYNQNAKDRTVASAYSVRPLPDARVSAPVTWEELRDCDPADFTVATMPRRFAEIGDPSAGIDEATCSLESILETSARHEGEGEGDAPWPPNYAKQPDEPPRVRPSAAKKATASPRAKVARVGRRLHKPLITIARAAEKADALAGLDRWKARHPDAAAQLRTADVLVDAMRGRSTTWTRIRINLEQIPEAERPPEEPTEPDYDPWGKPSK